MIRPHLLRQISLLNRQVQESLFHTHLVGLYSWDKVAHRKPKPVERERIGKPYDQGKFHDRIEMVFGGFVLLVLGPYEDDKHPCGLAKISRGQESVEGILDASTWSTIAEFIKAKRKEMDDEHPSAELVDGDLIRDGGAGANWGR